MRNRKDLHADVASTFGPTRRVREPRWPYDAADFDTRDEHDEHEREQARALIYDLPARPGTVR